MRSHTASGARVPVKASIVATSRCSRTSWAARGSTAQELLDLGPFVVVDGVEGVGAQQLVHLVGVSSVLTHRHPGRAQLASQAAQPRSDPALHRALGARRASTATSRYVWPPK